MKLFKKITTCILGVAYTGCIILSIFMGITQTNSELWFVVFCLSFICLLNLIFVHVAEETIESMKNDYTELIKDYKHLKENEKTRTHTGMDV